MMSFPERLLVVRLSALGDVVLSSVVLEAMRGHAQLAVCTRAPYAALFEGDPRVDRVIIFDPLDLGRARREIAAFDPSAVLDLQNTLRSRQLLRGIGGLPIERVEKHTWRRRLTAWGWRGRSPKGLVFERNLAALSRLTGSPVVPAVPRLVTDGESVRTRRVAISPGSAWANKRWPAERHVAVAEGLLAAGCEVDVLLSHEDSEIAEVFRSRLGHEERLFVRALSLPEFVKALSGAALLITGDSGPLHVAEAVGTPVVALYGPTTHHFGFRPFLPASRVLERPLGCRPCHVHGGSRCPLGHHRCMLEIRVDDVLGEATRLLEKLQPFRTPSLH